MVWYALVALLGLAGWGVWSARRILNPERHRPASASSFVPTTAHLLTAPDGTSHEVWLFEVPSPRALLLCCHGYHAARDQVSGLAAGLQARGYEALLVELRGHGNRPGPCTLGVAEAVDALEALRWAKSRRPNVGLPVGVVGFSMGGAVACQVAARDPDVGAVVIDSAYSRLFPVLQRALWLRYHLPAFPFAWVTWWSLHLALRTRLARVDPVALAPRLRQPLLAIQGGADQRVPPALGEGFYQRWAGPKERWGEADVAHVGMFAKSPEAYCDRVAGFFGRTLRAPA